jgi:hypothetical protein
MLEDKNIQHKLLTIKKRTHVPTSLLGFMILTNQFVDLELFQLSCEVQKFLCKDCNKNLSQIYITTSNLLQSVRK